jgi:hypothetical protein
MIKKLREINQIKRNSGLFKYSYFIDPKIFWFERLRFEIIIVDSALYYSSEKKYRLRTVQKLALYFYLFNSKMSRVLLQILTG